jgi:hypothetical protein
MQWITLSVTDLNNSRAAPIIKAAQTTVLATGQADPIPDLIAQVQAELRGMIGFSGRYGLDGSSGTSIPPNLKDMAVQKVAREVQARLHLPMSDQDKEDDKLYQARLLLIAQGKWPIDAPDVVSATNPDISTGRAEYLPGFTRVFTRNALDGL